MTSTPNRDKRIELKYPIDQALAEQVKIWAREHLGVDPHCCETLGDSYDVHTLYLDSPELDVYHRTGIAGSAKHRIRRYGQEELLWLESKRKQRDVVRKSRTVVPAGEVGSRLNGLPATEATPWCGDWFADRIHQRRLAPAIEVHYRRFARTATQDNENLRLTIDSNLQASRVSGWQESLISNRRDTAPRLDISPLQILELKFHNHMPLLFKELLQQFAIPGGSFSKYRTAVDVVGLAAAHPALQSEAAEPDAARRATTELGNGAANGEHRAIA